MKSRLIILLVTLLMVSHVSAQNTENEITRQVISMSALPNLPNHSLTSVIVELGPGSSAPSHSHEAFVFVYVINGTVLSQLNQEAAIVYSTGDSWTEALGDQHTVTKNVSETESAKILVVFVAENEARLTTLDDAL